MLTIQLSSWRRPLLVACLALAAVDAARAQIELDRRRAAPAKGEIDIENAFGSVVVRAWDRAEVQVRGTLAAGVEDFDLDGDKDGVQIDVDVPDAWIHAPGEDPAFRSRLEVTVPATARLSIRTINASIDVDGVSGRIGVDTINGAVRIAGAAAGVEVDSMTGNVEIHGRGAALEARTVSGEVLADGLRGKVSVETVSGKIELAGSELSETSVKTTTGTVALRGSLARRGSVEIETFSSPVRLTLPRTTRAEFELQSFAGKIQSDFCAGTPITHEPFEPVHKLRCSTGPDDFEVRVQTHDADITLAADGGPTPGDAR